MGISDYMQQRLTDITYFDPPKVGATIEQFDEVGTVESTKAVFEVISPVSGKVVRVNEAVDRHTGIDQRGPLRQLARRNWS